MICATPTRSTPSRRIAVAASLSTRSRVSASAAALAVAIAGALWITATPTSESTDDAYVAADATSVAPKIRGFVAAVLVRDNQQVRTGEPIACIDPEEFDARAPLRRTRHRWRGRVARCRQLCRRRGHRRTGCRPRPRAACRPGRDRRRHPCKHAGLLAALQTAQAKVAQARAAHDLALQDRRHTIIRAPVDGTVGNRQVSVGDYVQPGTRLLTLVPLHALYVTANFKETQTARMRPGQRVAINADALPRTDLTGRVESLAPGSDSSFSLLPFEPGTLVEIEEGRAVFEGQPDRRVYNPIGSVHGGYAATLLDSACGCAMHAALSATQGYTTLELKVAYHRPLSDASGPVRAEGRILSIGRRAAFAEATLKDANGRLCASATSTLLIFGIP